MGKIDTLHLNNVMSDNEPLYDLMPYKVKDILIISSLYDAYILENERLLREQIFGEYHQLNLTSAPRITHASSLKQGLGLLKVKSFDIIIVMRRLSDTNIFEIGTQIRAYDKRCYILLLLNNNSELYLFENRQKDLNEIDNIFVWNGDSKVFLAMIKYIEDKANAENDTRVSLARIILLVEDSIRYYSRLLPILYTQIMKQTQRIIAEECHDDMIKLLRMRARPKILLAKDYEDAVDKIDKYNDYLLCLISDVKFPKSGIHDEEAGYKLIKLLQARNADIPVLLQSSETKNIFMAQKLNADFMHKNSEQLEEKLTGFMLEYLGFGDFVFKTSKGLEIARAGSMEEFKKIIRDIPVESVVYHAGRNHFSSWLLARGEIQFAKELQPVKVNDFSSFADLKQYIIDTFEKVRVNSSRGRIIAFDESRLGSGSHIIRLSDGSLGGKGRGIAFINSLLQKLGTEPIVTGMDIMIPPTAIIGTDEFEKFMEKNSFSHDVLTEKDFSIIKQDFLHGELSQSIRDKLERFLSNSKYPIAVRSSGLFEDSFSFPFAGIYSTYLLPNNQGDPDMRLFALEQAIKLIYASMFSREAKAYFSAINYKMQEERMAIIIQKLIGHDYNGCFYPNISGTAKSYNFYPVSYIKMDDGFANIAVGLGKYVADGGSSYMFSPKHSRVDLMDVHDLLKNSQTEFFALDLHNNDFDLSRGEEATLKKLHIDEINEEFIFNCISVYDHQNDRIRISTKKDGPLIVNFSNILKYNSVPLAQTIDVLLGILEDAIGSAVEIEFAVDIDTKAGGQSPSFYILQIKPLLSGFEEIKNEMSLYDPDKLLLTSDKAVGNGIIKGIYDIVCIDFEKFDISKTREMAEELEKINADFHSKDKQYLLIGPGRWGTRDRWLGIPVSWPQISRAKVIVETGLKDFQVEASLGSHFFCNIISMNISYISVRHNKESNYLDFHYLSNAGALYRTEYFKIISLERPMAIIIDAKNGISRIYRD